MKKTAAQKRIEICKDVIENITTAQYRLESENSYLSVNYNSTFSLNVVDSSDVIQQCIPAIKKNCTLCAKGAILISKIDKFNNVTSLNTSDISSEYIEDSLEGIFDSNDLDLIETAFECDDYYSYYRDGLDDEALSNKAIKFGKQFDDDSDRLMAIMQNVIDHDGKFTPSTLYEIVEF